jgi:CHAD domain-containing protein
MSLELKPDEALRKGIRRIVRHEMDAALEELTGEHKGPRDGAVHEARKSFKKVRAVLRLIRPVIGEQTFRAENTCFRDAGRPLTEVRDAKMLVETLDKLTEHFQGHLAGQSFAETRKELQANLRVVRKRVLDDENAFAVVGEAVRQARERVKRWTDVPNKWSTVGAGLEDVYRQARIALGEAAREPTMENLHEWRKQTKYLRYQLEVLQSLWPERMAEMANETDHIGELLGDDHDLAVLRQMVTDDPEQFGETGEMELLVALIDSRRAELQQEALLLGGRFYQEKSRTFVRHLKGYWRTRAQAAAEPQGALAVSASA